MRYKLPILLVFLLVVVGAMQASAGQLLFQPSTSFPSAGRAYAAGVGDFNSDGRNDVAVTNSASQLLVYLQDSAGDLAAPVTYDAGSRPESLAVGDLNHDGRDDIAVTNVTTNTIRVYLQEPDGHFSFQVPLLTKTGPDALAVGDVNSDGLDDIAVSHWNAPYIGIFTQSPAGYMNAMATYASPEAGYDDISIGDINGDGRNDVVKMNGQGEHPNLSIYAQNEDGTLAAEQPYAISSCSYICLSHGVDTGDVTGDGRADIVLSYGGNRPDAGLAVFVQAPDGSLQAPSYYPAHDNPEPVEIADVNADDRADVLTLHGGRHTAGVFLQQIGTLSPYSLYSIPDSSHYFPQGLDIGDINNDAQPDLIIADYLNGLTVLYHTPAPDVTPPTISVAAVQDDGSPYLPGTWTNQSVTVKFTCSDSGAGIASCPLDATLSDEGVLSITGIATDKAGNSASLEFGPIKIDKTPPALFLGVSPNPVLLNGIAELNKNAADELSGIKPGSMPCLNIDTTTVGLKSVTCYVVDNAGNQTKATAEYQVIYDFDGFFNPVIDCVNNPCTGLDLSQIKAGSTIPFKFQLKDANGMIVRTASPPLWLMPIELYDLPPIWDPGDYTFIPTDIPFEWRKGQNQYMVEWSTKGLTAPSIWLVGVRLDDGMTYAVYVALIK